MYVLVVSYSILLLSLFLLFVARIILVVDSTTFVVKALLVDEHPSITMMWALALLLVSSSNSSNNHKVSAADFKLNLMAANVHWGYFSKTLDPVLTVPSGAEVEVEMATHHGCDDWDNIIEGDPGTCEHHT